MSDEESKSDENYEEEEYDGDENKKSDGKKSSVWRRARSVSVDPGEFAFNLIDFFFH